MHSLFLLQWIFVAFAFKRGKGIVECWAFEFGCVVCSEMRWKTGRYCSTPRCNPRYLVCSLRLPRWKVEPSVDLFLREGLASEVRRRPKAQGGYSQVPLSLPHVLRLSPPPSPRTRKQLASVIRCCTYFHHFIPLVLFVCFSIGTKVLCPLVTALLITIPSHLGVRSWREKEGVRDWEGPNVYHCRELNSRCWDNEENKQTIMQK